MIPFWKQGRLTLVLPMRAGRPRSQAQCEQVQWQQMKISLRQWLPKTLLVVMMSMFSGRVSIVWYRIWSQKSSNYAG